MHQSKESEMENIETHGLDINYVRAIREIYTMVTNALIKLNKYTLMAVESDADVSVDEKDKPTDLTITFHLTWNKKEGEVTESIVVPSADDMMKRVKARSLELFECNPGYKDPQYFVDVAIEEALFAYREKNDTGTGSTLEGLKTEQRESKEHA